MERQTNLTPENLISHLNLEYELQKYEQYMKEFEEEIKENA